MRLCVSPGIYEMATSCEYVHFGSGVTQSHGESSSVNVVDIKSKITVLWQLSFVSLVCFFS